MKILQVLVSTSLLAATASIGIIIIAIPALIASLS